jgi:DNA-binding HxlR family transcriptional regulator
MKKPAGSPLELSLTALSGKWKAPIICSLHDAGQPLGFAELKRAIPRITSRMLSRQLRELEKYGVISRHVISTSPLRVDYALTARGKTLQPILVSMTQWGKRGIPFVHDS